jgi:ribosomal protein S20
MQARTQSLKSTFESNPRTGDKEAAKKAGVQLQRRPSESENVLNGFRDEAKKLRISTGNSKDIQHITVKYVSPFDKAAKRHLVHKNFANKRMSGVTQSLFVVLSGALT